MTIRFARITGHNVRFENGTVTTMKESKRSSILNTLVIPPMPLTWQSRSQACSQGNKVGAFPMSTISQRFTTSTEAKVILISDFQSHITEQDFTAIRSDLLVLLFFSGFPFVLFKVAVVMCLELLFPAAPDTLCTAAASEDWHQWWAKCASGTPAYSHPETVKASNPQTEGKYTTTKTHSTVRKVKGKRFCLAKFSPHISETWPKWNLSEIWQFMSTAKLPILVLVPLQLFAVMPSLQMLHAVKTAELVCDSCHHNCLLWCFGCCCWLPWEMMNDSYIIASVPSKMATDI